MILAACLKSQNTSLYFITFTSLQYVARSMYESPKRLHVKWQHNGWIQGRRQLFMFIFSTLTYENGTPCNTEYWIEARRELTFCGLFSTSRTHRKMWRCARYPETAWPASKISVQIIYRGMQIWAWILSKAWNAGIAAVLRIHTRMQLCTRHLQETGSAGTSTVPSTSTDETKTWQSIKVGVILSALTSWFNSGIFEAQGVHGRLWMRCFDGTVQKNEK